MSKVLIKFHRDYADEFDVYGFYIVDKHVWEKHLKQVEVLSEDLWPIKKYFGTNEIIEWYSFEDYKGSFTVKDISDDEIKVIKSLLITYGNSYGNFLMIEDIPEED